MPMPIVEALAITARIAPPTTWDDSTVTTWDYSEFDGTYRILRTTSAWDAARNKGAGQVIQKGWTRVALPPHFDPNTEAEY